MLSEMNGSWVPYVHMYVLHTYIPYVNIRTVPVSAVQ